MTAEQNYRLLLDIDANRRFILQACLDNPELLACAEPRIRQWIQLDQSDITVTLHHQVHVDNTP